MNSKFTTQHDSAIKPQNLGPWLMKSSQSNLNLRSPSSYLARSYLIATVLFLLLFFRKEWSLDDDLIRQELSINNHLVFLPYVIKFITEENVDLETLSDTYSDAFKDYFKMLKSHLPRVTEFIDTFQLKVVENDCEETPNSSQLDASQESESGIESMASTRR